MMKVRRPPTMIELPRRSVTRFFIPLIDVMTLLFCIFLLMPIVEPDTSNGAGTTAGDSRAGPLDDQERRELANLRKKVKAFDQPEAFTEQERQELEQIR